MGHGVTKSWLVVQALLFALVACNSPPRPDELVSPVAISNISECGGGLNLSHNLSLKADIDRELASGQLSMGARRSLEAAFIRKLGHSDADSKYIFQMYTDCITGKINLSNTISTIDERGRKLHSELVQRQVAEQMILEIESLREHEKAALLKPDFLAARDFRSRSLAKIVMALVNSGGLEGFDVTLSTRNEPRTKADARKRFESYWDKHEQDLAKVCSLYGDPAACRAAAQIAVIGPKFEASKCLEPTIEELSECIARYYR